MVVMGWTLGEILQEMTVMQKHKEFWYLGTSIVQIWTEMEE